MKRNMKRVLLVLCMVTCLFSLSACSQKAAEDGLDEQIEAIIKQSGEGLLKELVGMDEAEAAQYEEAFLKQNETGLASGLTSWLSVMKDTGSFVQIISSEAAEPVNHHFS